MDPDKKTRRKFLKESAALALTTMAFPAWNNEAIALDAFQAMGTRVGEVTDATAIIWTRLTAKKERNNKGIIISDKADPNWTPIIYEENILGRSSNEAFNFSNKRKQYF
jgi:phosphodiesterase/alkaline phosphatase D-like protein